MFTITEGHVSITPAIQVTFLLWELIYMKFDSLFNGEVVIKFSC